MHAFIYQISSTPISEEMTNETLLDPNTNQFQVDHYFDYMHELYEDSDEEQIEEAYQDLQNLFPEGAIEHIGNGTFRKIGNTDTMIINETKDAIINSLQKVDALEFYPVLNEIAEKAANPLGTDNLFVIDDMTSAEKSLMLVDYISRMPIGDIFYVGTIIDYHF